MNLTRRIARALGVVTWSQAFDRLRDAALQAERDSRHGEVPLVVMEQPNGDDALVVMRRETFRAWFGSAADQLPGESAASARTSSRAGAIRGSR